MIEHRKELRHKVELRQRLLQQALRASESAGHPSERISGLNTELNVVADSLGGGWENMTDITAERLSIWLETTATLLPNEKPKGISKPLPLSPLPPSAADAMVQEGGHDPAG